MGLFDTVLSKFNPMGSSVTPPSGGTSLISYAIAPASTVINEGYAKVNGVFGGTGPFSKMNGAAPSFTSLGVAGSFAKPFSALDVQGLGAFGPFGQPGNPYSLVAAGEAVKLGTAEPGVTAAGVREAVGEPESPEDESHKVRLTAPAASSSPDGVREVVFDIMPEVTEVRSAEYEPLSPSQLPGEFQKYKGTKSVQWNITARLVASTKEEAARNHGFVNALRGWTMPYFGEAQRANFKGLLGAPPPVLTLSGWRSLVGPIPVVLTQVNWTWPQEVDWLPTGLNDGLGQEIPFPAVMNLTINLVESLSPAQFNAFDLIAYRDGRMVDAFDPQGAQADGVDVSEPPGGQGVVTNATASPEVWTDEGDGEEILYLRDKAAESTAKSGLALGSSRLGATSGPRLGGPAPLVTLGGGD